MQYYLIGITQKRHFNWVVFQSIFSNFLNRIKCNFQLNSKLYDQNFQILSVLMKKDYFYSWIICASFQTFFFLMLILKVMNIYIYLQSQNTASYFSDQYYLFALSVCLRKTIYFSWSFNYLQKSYEKRHQKLNFLWIFKNKSLEYTIFKFIPDANLLNGAFFSALYLRIKVI